MTSNDRLQLLRQAVDEAESQAIVARRLGYSPTAISQALNGKYGGALDTLLTRVEEVYGNRIVECPVLGDIALAQCADQRRKPFSAANHLQVRLFRVCRQCGNNTDERGKGND